MPRQPILIVHPEPTLRRLLRTRLERDGAEVREAAIARRAVEAQRAGPPCNPVVLCEGEPGGMTADEFVEAVRDIDHATRIYFFAGRYPDVTAGPAVRVFPKPGGLDGLIRACLGTD
jgi:DNA-binding NtrC family response regulator